MIPPSYIRIRSPCGLSILCAAERNRWTPISSSPPSGKKTETRFNCLLTENRKSTKMVGTPSTVCGLLPPPTGRSPSLDEGGLGFRRSRPPALPSIAYRGFAVAPKPLRAPSRRFLYNSGCRVATLLVSMGVMGFLGDLRGRNSKSPPNPLGLAERVYSFHRLRTVPLPR